MITYYYYFCMSLMSVSIVVSVHIVVDDIQNDRNMLGHWKRMCYSNIFHYMQICLPGIQYLISKSFLVIVVRQGNKMINETVSHIIALEGPNMTL